MGSPLVVDIYFLLAALLLQLGQPISFVRTCHISQCHAPAPITKSDTAKSDYRPAPSKPQSNSQSTPPSHTSLSARGLSRGVSALVDDSYHHFLFLR